MANPKPKRNPRRPASTRRRTTTRKKRCNPPVQHKPRWVVSFIAVIAIILLTGSFYYYFVRPYSYRWKPCYGHQAYGVCIPYGFAIHGIDISHYQGSVNWSVLALNQQNRYPLRFVFMKATEGGDLADHTFQDNFAAAREHGFIRGAYHFYNSRTDAVKQADFFTNTVKLEKGDLPPVLDIEITGKKEKNELVSSLKIWLERVESYYNVKPILYTSYKFRQRFLDDPFFDKYPYWIAHYYVDSVRYEGEWHFWQHTDVGRVPGIKEEVDLNVFNGTLEELYGLTIQ
ncbi:MAG: glycoside hydrolase family 25 protein [Bacteroides sp.]|nr:glycoside hydrolase family 25 protein [Bacteroides sp.]